MTKLLLPPNYSILWFGCILTADCWFYLVSNTRPNSVTKLIIGSILHKTMPVPANLSRKLVHLWKTEFDEGLEPCLNVLCFSVCSGPTCDDHGAVKGTVEASTGILFLSVSLWLFTLICWCLYQLLHLPFYLPFYLAYLVPFCRGVNGSWTIRRRTISCGQLVADNLSWTIRRKI